MKSTVRAAALAVGLALVITPTLSGCFGNPVEQIIEGATGTDVDLGGGSLPDGYPASEVPVVDGEIVYSLKVGAGQEQVFNVTVETGADPTDQVKSQLTSAGFSEDQLVVAETSEGSTFTGTNDRWGVVVLIGQIDGKWTVNYTVTAAGASN